jgi:hypothetical protein
MGGVATMISAPEISVSHFNIETEFTFRYFSIQLPRFEYDLQIDPHSLSILKTRLEREAKQYIEDMSKTEISLYHFHSLLYYVDHDVAYWETYNSYNCGVKIYYLVVPTEHEERFKLQREQIINTWKRERPHTIRVCYLCNEALEKVAQYRAIEQADPKQCEWKGVPIQDKEVEIFL